MNDLEIERFCDFCRISGMDSYRLYEISEFGRPTLPTSGVIILLKWRSSMGLYQPFYEIPEKGEAVILTKIGKICDFSPNMDPIDIGVGLF